MYIEDDICYAGNPGVEPRVVGAQPLTGGMLLVPFSTGERRLFDSTVLTGGAFGRLRDPEVFQKLHVAHGFVSWDDGQIDVAPEYMYENSIPYDETDVVSLAS